MSISKKMLDIIGEECKKVTTDNDTRYDDYEHDLFELIADVASLEATHSQKRINVVQSIRSKIDAIAEILLKHDETDSEEK